jgi:hypothetical protein
MLVIKVLSGLSFIGSIIWFIAQPDYEPAIAIVTSFSAFIATWISDKKTKRKGIQNQTVADGGVGIQAGGDINAGNITVNKKN